MAKKKQHESVETRKQSRLREREQEQLRLIYIALGVVAAVILFILAFGYWRTVIAVQDETIATVNGTTLKVRDYQTRARYDAALIGGQLQQIQQALSQFNPNDPSMASITQYYQTQAQQEESKLLQVPGQALEDLIDDELVRQEAQKRGITVSDAEIDHEIELQIKQGLGYPRPTETSTAGPSPTPTLTPTNTATPSVSPTATATVTGTVVATPTEGPTATPEPTQTPLSPEAYATDLAKLKENVSNAHYSFDSYRGIIEIQLLRQKLNDVLAQAIPTTGEQIHVEHILVKTFDEAQAVEKRLAAGEDFSKVAQDVSIDPSAKTNSGDLGWASPGTFVKEFDDAAFALPVLQVSQPVTSSFGVHVIKVLEKDANRALDDTTLSQKRAAALDNWLQQARVETTTNIQRFFSTDYVPSEIERLQTPSAQQ